MPSLDVSLQANRSLNDAHADAQRAWFIQCSQSADGSDWKPTIIYLIWILQFKHDSKILVLFYCNKHETRTQEWKKKKKTQCTNYANVMKVVIHSLLLQRLKNGDSSSNNNHRLHVYMVSTFYKLYVSAFKCIQYKNRAKMLHRINGQRCCCWRWGYV